LNSSYRRDATSQLAPENRAQIFWSVGAGWVVTNESFLNETETLNLLKLKGSIGELGNQFAPVNCPYYPGVDEGATAVFGERVVPGCGQSFVDDASLKVDTVKLWEVGFESSWLDRRLIFNAYYYNREFDDLLVFVDTGVERFFDLSGEIRNK